MLTREPVPVRLLASLLCLAAFGLGCSRTAPESQWPPPGPSSGIPVKPFPDESGLLDEMLSGSEDVAEETEAPGPKLGDLPESPPAVLERTASCAKKSCALEKWLPDAKYAKNTHANAPSPGAIWIHTIEDGSTVSMPRHHELEVMAVVLQGKVLASSDDAKTTYGAGVWEAVRVPGAGFTLRADGGEAKVLMALVTTKDTIDDALGHAKAKPWEVRWRKRPRPMQSFDLTKQEKLGWGGGKFVARIAVGGKDQNQQTASLGTLQAAVDGSVPEHDHPTWEHIAILSGAGRMQLGGQDYPVEPGKLFHIPSEIRHSFTAAGSQELLAVQLYTPSGPEQRFVELAKGASKKASKPKGETKQEKGEPAGKPAPAGKPKAGAKPAK